MEWSEHGRRLATWERPSEKSQLRQGRMTRGLDYKGATGGGKANSQHQGLALEEEFESELVMRRL